MAAALPVSTSCGFLERSLLEHRVALARLEAEAERLCLEAETRGDPLTNSGMSGVHWRLCEVSRNLDAALSGLDRLRKGRMWEQQQQEQQQQHHQHKQDADDASPFYHFGSPLSGEDLERWKPFTLTREHKPRDLRRWKWEFRMYFEAGRYDRHPTVIQRMMLSNCLDRDLQERTGLYWAVAYKPGKEVDERPIFPDGDGEEDGPSWMRTLEEVFLELYPLFCRRRDFFTSVQEEGQSAFGFISGKQCQARESRLDEMTADDMVVHRAIDGLNDMEIKKELLRMLREEGPMIESEKFVLRAIRIERDREEVAEMQARAERLRLQAGGEGRRRKKRN